MNIGFIGGGNMASAIIKGAIKSGFLNPQDINVFDINDDTLNEHKKLGVNIKSSEIEVESASDVVFVTIKPQFYEEVLNKLSGSNKVFVTVAPGVSINFVKNILGEKSKVIRTMPNTPALVGEGMTVICKDNSVDDEKYNFVKGIFESVSKVKELSENLLNASVSVSGSSPAYVYMLIEAMTDAAVKFGIDRDTALKMSAQAVYGSAKMVLETNEDPKILRDRVCSPNGTTIKAVEDLEKNNLHDIIVSAMDECLKRAIELSK